MTTYYDKILSSDGIHSLNVKVFKPEGDPKGIYQFVHGMTEHIERYNEMFTYICENGYIVVSHDNLGHGKTTNSDDELGFIAEKNGYSLLADDVKKVNDYIKNAYPGLPVYLHGHSMGSFIVRLFEDRYPSDIDKLIIEGTGGPNKKTNLGLAIIKCNRILFGKKHISFLVYMLAFGGYNKKFEGDNPYRWLTVNSTTPETYAGDKYCNYMFTVSAMEDLIMLNKLTNSKKWFKNYRKDLPTFIISGDMDPVGDFSKGVTAVYNNLKNNGVFDISMKLYKNARHEIHNDFCKKEAFEDIVHFLNK